MCGSGGHCGGPSTEESVGHGAGVDTFAMACKALDRVVGSTLEKASQEVLEKASQEVSEKVSRMASEKVSE